MGNVQNLIKRTGPDIKYYRSKNKNMKRLNLNKLTVVAVNL